MKLEQTICSLLVFAVLFFCLADPVCGKRAFAIRMRGRSNSNSGGTLGRSSRKNYHNVHTDTGNNGMVRNPPVSDVQPARPVGWNTDNGGAIGPPPAYPGLGHHAVPAGGAPPAYSRINPPSYAEAIGYSSYGNGYGSAGPSGRHYDYNTNYNNLHNSYEDNLGYGSRYGYHRGSNPFSVGNILTGVALWQLGRGLSHHHHHHYDVHPNYYEHNANKNEETVGSTLSPEIENPHIQVNADFDFGPSPASVEVSTQKVTAEHTLSSLSEQPTV